LPKRHKISASSRFLKTEKPPRRQCVHSEEIGAPQKKENALPLWSWKRVVFVGLSMD